MITTTREQKKKMYEARDWKVARNVTLLFILAVVLHSEVIIFCAIGYMIYQRNK